MNRPATRQRAGLRGGGDEFELPTITLGPNMPGATCKGLDPRLWDRSVEGETNAQRAARYTAAIESCQVCPARALCLDYRLAHPELHGGVWGGCLFADKGSRPVELPTATRPAAKPSRQCPECGGEFTSEGHGRQYCSTTCRDVAGGREKAAKRKAQRRARGTPAAPEHCQRPECGRDLTPDQQHRQERYCSDTCRKAADRDRKRVQRSSAGRAA